MSPCPYLPRPLIGHGGGGAGRPLGLLLWWSRGGFYGIEGIKIEGLVLQEVAVAHILDNGLKVVGEVDIIAVERVQDGLMDNQDGVVFGEDSHGGIAPGEIGLSAQGIQKKCGVFVTFGQGELEFEGGVTTAILSQGRPEVQRGELLLQGGMFAGQDILDQAEVFSAQEAKKVGGIFKNGQEVGGLFFIDRGGVEDLGDQGGEVGLERHIQGVGLDVLLPFQVGEKLREVSRCLLARVFFWGRLGARRRGGWG